MHFFSYLALAYAACQFVSALPVSISTNDIVGRDDLFANIEVRTPGKGQPSKKYVPPPPPKVTFEKGLSPHSAHDRMSRLGLQSHSRKAVEKWHQNLVQDHMATIPGAHHAVVKQIAHRMGSRDPYIHVSATIYNERGQIIPHPRRGNPAIQDPTHHIYVNQEHPDQGYKNLPKEYKDALIRAGHPPGVARR